MVIDVRGVWIWVAKVKPSEISMGRSRKIPLDQNSKGLAYSSRVAEWGIP